ncbi:type IV pilin protein [Zoogloea sp.]|jgi:type IV pilus assembly protein PilE|uniref:type IV pilin protein n=1 Tax=Zoogloea sp. TaxID=49181 RepID=UPI0035B3B6CE
MKPNRQRRRQAGLTLIELMVAVCIVGILTMIAYPNYSSYVMRSKRNLATACLQEAAQYMERFYTSNLRYDQATDGTAVALPATACVNDMKGTYVLAIASVSANAFVLKITPQGGQASADTQCGTLTLAHTGAKTVSGTGTPNTCW